MPKRLKEELAAWLQWARSKSSATRSEAIPVRADIGLIQCPMWSENWPSLSLGFLSSSTESHGIRTAVFDLNIALFNAAPEKVREYWHWSKVKYWENDQFIDLFFKRFHREIESHIETIMTSGCRLIGFSVFDSSRLFSIRLAKEIKARSPKTHIIFGGPGVDQPYWRKLVPSSCCDAFVIGEGEITLMEVYRSLIKRESIDPQIAGLICEEGAYHPRPQVRNLDDLPYPTWRNFDIGSYRASSLPLLFSRGCICRCSFCTDTFYFKKYRYRSPENIMREIRSHVDRYGVRTFRSLDLMINGNLEALDGLCEDVISSGLEIRWEAMVTASSEMTLERYNRLRKAGCVEIDLGVESGSDRVLKFMRKIATAEEISRNIRRADQAGIKVNISLVVGHPGEEEEDLKATLDFLKKHSDVIHRINNVNHCLVMFHSDIRNHPESYGIVLPDPPETAFFRWRSMDGRNTLELRVNRLRKVLDCCESLGIPVSFANFFDGGTLDMKEARRVLQEIPELS